MLSLTHQFLAWCRSKPADERYQFADPRSCAFYQFAVEIGISDPIRDELPLGFAELIQAPELMLDDDDGRTFGQLADRVERQLAEQVRA